MGHSPEEHHSDRKPITLNLRGLHVKKKVYNPTHKIYIKIQINEQFPS